MEFILKEFLKCAELVSQENLTYSYTGNMSRIFSGKLYITRTGANFRNLSEGDILELPLEGESILEERASSELIVHRRVLRETEHKALLHTHPVYAVMCSLKTKEITPLDSEGKAILGKVNVLELENSSASEELAQNLAEELKEKSIAVIKGHGVFAGAENLIRAYEITSVLENSCKILLGVEYGGKG
ncbi:class II aldolase/adducin family protein [Aquifex aeolicus]|uniref:Fuculose-1-phosphate aldolase n=1 Tax=Aquifex aeolicus (strain VF5) TaxID=224324 RepID=O67574_AQUAE|nr:class II aldolase/adducin family protein [Aquifex aeolicus]AAC07526.1 fuculose-1-phosphate aldolase [Aquifex aeolicus VF5]